MNKNSLGFKGVKLLKNGDPGDKYDSLKWDFPENSLIKIQYNNILYKVNDRKNLYMLIYIKSEIDRLIEYLKLKEIEYFEEYYNYYGSEFTFEEFLNSLMLFFNTTYLVSEIPLKYIGKPFEGLNKPKERYISKKPYFSTGRDNILRAKYRDIFLDIFTKDIRSLIIHELAHGLANHILYRDAENHAKDFNLAERILEDCANSIGFLTN